MSEVRRTRAAGLAAAGLALGLLGAGGYFVLALHLGPRLPALRNGAAPSWILIALGIAVSVMALVRATRRRVSGLLLGLNVAVAAAFAAMLYVVTVVPRVAGPPVGAPAPSFALVDQGGRTVRLEDFRGAPLLLVFYRGHW